MAVYVDPLMPVYSPTAPACFRGAGAACHLFADTVEELHGFAARLGLDRAWFQGRIGRTPHYDLTSKMRAKAVQCGALEIGYKEVVEIIRKFRTEKGGEETMCRSGKATGKSKPPKGGATKPAGTKGGKKGK